MKFVRCLAWLALVSMVAGCSSGKLVKAYPGETLPDQDLIKLVAGENLVIVSVNDETVPDYLLSDISVNYGLTPGLNKVIFQYESVWARRARSEDESRAEAVVSELREVSFSAKAGDTLSFQYEQAENVREARALAAGFEAEIVNQRGQVLAKSSDVTKVSPIAYAVPAYGASTAGVVNNQGLPKLEALKVLWSEMSVEEQKSFLKWAFQ